MAREWCAGIAVRHGLELAHVVGAAAALSPQVSWLDQCRYFPGFVESVLGGDSATLPHPGFYGNRTRAARILCGADPLAVLGGPKVRAFHAAIMGDASAVVVDRHAAALALGERRKDLSALLIAEVQEAYTLAAAEVAIAPRELQALLWCVHKARGDTGAEDQLTFWSEAPETAVGLGLALSDEQGAPFGAAA